MLINKMLYTLDDITIIPAVQSYIRHRAECDPSYYGKLPLITSPMASVISKDNFHIFEEHNILSILPRTEEFEDRLSFLENSKWVAFGLDEFESLFCNEGVLNKTKHYRVLIDIANGHVSTLIDDIKLSKSMYNVDIMCGNVANPETFKVLAEAGAWGVRCSIGTGNCCITASNTAVYCPMASLLDECYKIKQENSFFTNIICDGGIRNYSDIIKALALGADYCMCGTLFAKFYESAAYIHSFNLPAGSYLQEVTLSTLNDIRFGQDNSTKKDYIKRYFPLKKTIFGMSTRKAQEKIAQAKRTPLLEYKTKTSEGVEKEIIVEYTIVQWVENFIDYLCSAMSYCNKVSLFDFVGKVKVMLLSPQSKLAINK